MSESFNRTIRHIIRGRLVTAAPLAIHAGLRLKEAIALGLTNIRRSLGKGDDAPEDLDNLIVRDWAGKPYIPGASLKGVLNHYVARSINAARGTSAAQELWDLHEKMFGVPSQEEDEGAGGSVVFEDAFLDEGQGEPPDLSAAHDAWLDELRRGTVSTDSRAYALAQSVRQDAFTHNSWRASHGYRGLLTSTSHLPWWSGEDLSYIENHVAINRRTGTADENKLFNTEVVPLGIPFCVVLIVDDDDPDLVRFVLRTLAAFNLDPVHAPPQLGSETANGWGMMNWDSHRTTVSALFFGGEHDSWDHKHVLERQLETTRDPPASSVCRIQFDLRLDFSGPFIVNDTSRTGATEDVPDHYPRKAECITDCGNEQEDCGIPLLPSSSFKGVFRSQLERILRTIDASYQVSPLGQFGSVPSSENPILRRFFGTTGNISAIWCNDFVGEKLLPVLKQEMVAIDRWTGGVAGSAKFDVCYFRCPQLRGFLAIEFPSIEAQPGTARFVLGLLTLGMRDLIEGDMSFGFGESKGFGEGRAAPIAITVAGLASQPDVQKLLKTHDLPDNDQGVNQLLRQDAWRTPLSANGDSPETDFPELRQRADEFLNSVLHDLRSAQVPNEE